MASRLFVGRRTIGRAEVFCAQAPVVHTFLYGCHVNGGKLGGDLEIFFDGTGTRVGEENEQRKSTIRSKLRGRDSYSGTVSKA
jgi:hypothetical protein